MFASIKTCSAVLAAVLALSATAAVAEKTIVDGVIVQDVIAHDSARAMAVWGDQINNRGWDTGKNFPVKHPQRNLDVNKVPAAAAFAGLNMGQRMFIQKRLASYGLYVGRIDGRWGPQTWSAVRGYAEQAGVYDELRTRKGSYGVFQGIGR